MYFQAVVHQSKMKSVKWVLPAIFFIIMMYSKGKTQMFIGIKNTPVYYTPMFDTFYLPGSFNNWDPATQTHYFEGNIVSIPAFSGTAEYKVTRGSWTTVEIGSDGLDIPNRMITYTEGDTFWIDVAEWHDFYRTGHTVSGDVRIIKSDFLMPQTGRKRTVWIWLPEDYQHTGENYPVLYMHDGQNVFDRPYSFAGEWKVDEAMTAFKDSLVKSCIVVAVNNGEGARIEEYTPHRHPTYGGGGGEAYVAFLVETLKPFIDAHFRTKSEAIHTGIAGSSLGGLISFYAGLKHPDVFGKVGVFSPSFWYSDSLELDVKAFTPQSDQKYYIVGARNEDEDMEPDIDKYISLMTAQGVQSSNIKKKVLPNGAHSEWFWAQEFPDAYQWLNIWNTSLSKNTFQTMKSGYFYINENPTVNPIILCRTKISGTKNVRIFDTVGKEHQIGSMNQNNEFIVSDSIAPGIYFAKIIVGGRIQETIKFIKK